MTSFIGLRIYSEEKENTPWCFLMMRFEICVFFPLFHTGFIYIYRGDRVWQGRERRDILFLRSEIGGIQPRVNQSGNYF